MKECRAILDLEEYFESGLQSVILTEYLEVVTKVLQNKQNNLSIRREGSCLRGSAARSTGSLRTSAECFLNRYNVVIVGGGLPKCPLWAKEARNIGKFSQMTV